MGLSFLTPWGGLFVLAALAPLAVLRARGRHIDRIRSALGLDAVAGRSRAAHALALTSLCALLALAAAQPVVTTSRTLMERTDAQVFFVLDTSRSMLASASPEEPTRFDRSRDLAQALADRLPEVPIGIASFTDRVLPHLFPTVDHGVFTATLQKTMRVESPGPAVFYPASRATSYDVLADLPTRNYFAPATTRRVAVVFTDGESRPGGGSLSAAFEKKPPVELVFVRLWDAGERINVTGVPEAEYTPDPASEADLRRVAASIGGVVVGEGETARLAEVVGELVGTGPTRARENEGRRRSLMPWFALAAALPLGFVFLRRNVWRTPVGERDSRILVPRACGIARRRGQPTPLDALVGVGCPLAFHRHGHPGISSRARART
jgi:von Willebrand factor type A domain